MRLYGLVQRLEDLLDGAMFTAETALERADKELSQIFQHHADHELDQLIRALVEIEAVSTVLAVALTPAKRLPMNIGRYATWGRRLVIAHAIAHVPMFAAALIERWQRSPRSTSVEPIL